jgi:hypothetical protein
LHSSSWVRTSALKGAPRTAKSENTKHVNGNCRNICMLLRFKARSFFWRGCFKSRCYPAEDLNFLEVLLTTHAWKVCIKCGGLS